MDTRIIEKEVRLRGADPHIVFGQLGMTSRQAQEILDGTRQVPAMILREVREAVGLTSALL